ncbi:uncharacterized protein LOC119291772 isoform X2 [Triticum dicoccoides]|uniref:uncharacterized protein LOC119291772 isoform X2 n=1 Tax=Triticum dicoccoides TaxID=85692 RepID=UPI00188E2630|nr:uncharacterized protein LOC119291772 isoform X2 [Triticum dicoccoides]
MVAAGQIRCLAERLRPVEVQIQHPTVLLPASSLPSRSPRGQILCSIVLPRRTVSKVLFSDVQWKTSRILHTSLAAPRLAPPSGNAGEEISRLQASVRVCAQLNRVCLV